MNKITSKSWKNFLKANFGLAIDYLMPLLNLIPFCRHPIKSANALQENPFFIIGSGRSGTTLLRRLIVQNPEVHIPPETYVLGRMVSLFRGYAGNKWDDIVNLMLATIEYQNDFDTFNISSLQPLALRLKKVPQADRSLSLIVDQFYRYHADTQGVKCRIWGDKTPLNTLHLRKISKVFPRAKYIYITRNGYDVAYSYYKSGLYNSWLHAALRWKNSNKKALEFERKNPDKVFRVRYEDMVRDPEAVVPSVFSFLQLDYKSTYIETPVNFNMGDVEKKRHHRNVQADITASQIGKGFKTIPTTHQFEIRKIVEPMNRKLGYL